MEFPDMVICYHNGCCSIFDDITLLHTLKSGTMKKAHGGKRKNSGRKPVTDKKKQVTLYVLQSMIDKLGGEAEMKKYIYETIEKRYNDKLNE